MTCAVLVSWLFLQYFGGKQIAKEKVLQELKIELPDSLIATKEDYCLPSHLKNYKSYHGFAHVQLDNEQFEVRNYKIINNKIY